MFHRRLIALLVLAAVAGLGVSFATTRLRSSFGASDVHAVEPGCGLGPHILERIQNGSRSDRSEDVITVPKAPNYLGSFAVTSHSGPWDYLQRVPLVAYGPKHVPSRGQLTRAVTLADVYSTVEDWTQTELRDRAGRSLVEAVQPTRKPPRLLVFVMWDGVGRNVLERWPDRWPNLQRLERQGTSYIDATVGSSPSITPATHATLGTGSFPKDHGITGIQYRGPRGEIEVAFSKREPNHLELTTFADDFDRRHGNVPKVGLVGLRIWHIPMMGHGTATRGGDRDHLALIGFDGKINGNQDLYETPRYLHGFSGLARHIDELDQRDGIKDGKWREHPIAEEHDNPAWVRYQTDVLFEMWEREAYGRDATSDMFFVNYKMTDIVGHRFSMDSEEMGDILKAQDEELGKIVDYLDENVRDYVLLLSADHGHTPSPERSGAWPIDAQELEDDVHRRFGIPAKTPLIEMKTAVGLFIDDKVARDTSTSEADISRYLNRYTIGDNSPKDEIPRDYLDRKEALVFEAVFPASDLQDVIDCSARSNA